MDENWEKQGGDSVFEQYISGRGGPTSKFRNLSAGETCAFADALLEAIAKGEIKGLTEKESSDSSDGDGTSIKFRLPMGAYLIKLGNGSTRVYQPIVTHVDPEWTENDGYKLKVKTISGAPSDTNIEAKSKEIVSTKTVANKGESSKTKTKAHSQIGDDLDFMIKTPIPNYPPRTRDKKFGVQDWPSAGLTIDSSSVRVWIEGKSVQPLNETTDYSMTNLVAGSNNRGQGFKVEFNHSQYTSKLAAAGKGGMNLIIKYKAKVNGKAPIVGGTENRTEPLILKDNYAAKGEYTGFGRPTVTTVYTYGVELTKVDAEHKDKKLKGAHFKLRRRPSKDLLKRGKQTTEVKVKQNGTQGQYIVSPEGTDTIISGDNGVVRIDGLSAADLYELTEIRAPRGGYALPAEPIMIDIRDQKINNKDESENKLENKAENKPNEPDGIPDDTSVIGGQFVTPDQHNRLTFNLTNKKADFKLPRTGAIGAVVFGVFGVVLVAISVAVVAVHRRRARR